MTIEIISDATVITPDEVKAGRVHYVAIAREGLTFSSEMLVSAGGFSYHEKDLMIRTVNNAREAGTVYPRCSLTLLPLGVDDRRDIYIILEDAFKAEFEHIKSLDMVFDFRFLVKDEYIYHEVLRQVIEALPTKQDNALRIRAYFPSRGKNWNERKNDEVA
jgi:hypothetical protein